MSVLPRIARPVTANDGTGEYEKLKAKEKELERELDAAARAGDKALIAKLQRQLDDVDKSILQLAMKR